MADVAVTPEHLNKLATAQEQASTQAGTAASAAANLEVAVWVSHGVVSGASNVAFTKAAAARQKTGQAMSTASTSLPESCAPPKAFTRAPTSSRARTSTSRCLIAGITPRLTTGRQPGSQHTNLADKQLSHQNCARIRRHRLLD